MQQPAAFKTVRRHILILPPHNGKAREYRVTVLAVVVNRVAAIGVKIGMILPQRISQKFVLRLAWPVAMAMSVHVVASRHLLQKHQIRVERTQLIAQCVNHHAPVKNRQAFVNVAGGDAQLRNGRLLKAVHL